jgi:hypothetical protein
MAASGAIRHNAVRDSEARRSHPCTPRSPTRKEAVVDIPTDVAVGSAHFTAANGDSVLAEFVAQSDPTEDPEVLWVEEAYTITGGTGRFAGASGGFTVERLFNLVTASPPVRSTDSS